MAYKSVPGLDKRGDCFVRQQAVWSIEVGVDRDAHRGFSKEIETREFGGDDVQMKVRNNFLTLQA